MAKKLIPYEQALRLDRWSHSWKRGSELIAGIQRELERERLRLVAAYEFAGIPLDGQVDVKLEDGPDEQGMVAVEWKDKDDAIA